jgi:hypothetical protein
MSFGGMEVCSTELRGLFALARFDILFSSGKQKRFVMMPV